MGRIVLWINICQLPACGWIVMGEMYVSSLVNVSRPGL